MSTYLQVRKWTNRSKGVLWMAAVPSGGFTFFGLMADSNASVLISALRALISVVASVVLWSFLFEHLASVTKPESRKNMIVMAVISVFVLMSISSYYGVSGIAAGRAQQHHLELILKSASEKLDELVVQKKKELSIQDSLDTAAQVFLQHSKSEARFGAISGKRGKPGPISNSLNTLSQGFSSLSEKVNDTSNKIQRHTVKGYKALSQIRETIDGDYTITQKNEAVQRLANSLSDTLFELNNIDVTGDVENLVDQIDELYFLTDNEAAQTMLKEPIEKVKLMLHEQVAQLKGRPVKLERYRVLSGVEAIQMYLPHVWPEVASCLTIDLLLPLLMLFIIHHVSRNQKGETSEGKEENDANVYSHGRSATGGSTISSLLETRLNDNRKKQRQHAG